MTKGPVRLPRTFGRGIPGADRRATELLLNLVKTTDLAVIQLARQLRPAGLSPTAFNTLMILQGDEQPLCPSEIGDRLVVTRGTVTGVLDSLEKKGLIKRLPDENDRRMLRIQITSKALKLLDQITPSLHAHEASLFALLTASEKDDLLRLLGKALEGVEQGN